MIQDYILTAVGIVFAFSLIPLIIKVIKTKEVVNISYITTILTSVGLLIMSITFFTMKCYFTGITNLLTCACWSILLYLKFKYGNKK